MLRIIRIALFLSLSLALQTGRILPVTHESKSYSFGAILDPAALIQALQE